MKRGVTLNIELKVILVVWNDKNNTKFNTSSYLVTMKIKWE